MKLVNVIAIVMVAIFFFSATGFCNDVEQGDNTSSHCLMHCSSGCHTSIPQSNISSITPSAVSSVTLLYNIFPETLVIREILRPPKTA